MKIPGIDMAAQGTAAAAKPAAKPATGFAKQMAYAMEKNMGADLEPIFEKAAKQYGVPKDLLQAIGFHESGYQASAVSSAGAMGIMQLMPATAQTMGVADPYDAEQNIMGGAKLLGQYAKQYDGDLKLMLAAYGAGSGAVAKYNGVPPYQETKQFVEDIMSVVDEKIMSQTEEPQEPVYQEYPSLWNEMRNFSAYTPTDYEIFLSCMLSMQSTDLLTPLDEQKERHQNFNPYLFYLG